jgi:hypothetical protein
MLLMMYRLVGREMLPSFIDQLNCLDVGQLIPMSAISSAGPCVRHTDNNYRKPLTIASHADVNKFNTQYKFVKDSPLLNDLIIHREKATQEIYQVSYNIPDNLLNALLMRF